MQRLGTRAALVFAALAMGVGAYAWGRWAGAKLYLDGKVASSEVFVRDGEAYVPLRDVASALSMTVQTRPDGYALVRAGGANQMAGLGGKVGDDLFNGSFRLKVLQVTRTDTYKRQLSAGDDIAAQAGQEIIAVAIRIKNGTQKTQNVMYLGSVASLTDDDGHSYEVTTGDSHGRNQDILPGAAIDGVLLFMVPRGAVPKDLVYKVDCFTAPSTQPFRISLKPDAGKP